MTGRIQSTTLYWDMDNPNVQVPDSKRIPVIQFGSKDRFHIGSFDLQGLQIRSPSAITILGYVPSHSVSIGLLLGGTRIIFGDNTRSCSVITALSRSLHTMDLFGICVCVPKADSDPYMGVIMPHIENRDSLPDRLLLVRCPFSDDIQNLQAISAKYPLQLQEPLSQDEETVCDNFIDSLMLPENDSSDVGYDTEFPLNPTHRLFHHFARDKATHVNQSVPCSHHTYGSAMFLRNKVMTESNHETNTNDESYQNGFKDTSNHEKKETEEENGDGYDVEDVITEDHEDVVVDQTVHNVITFEKDEEENLLSTPTSILEKARSAIEQFRYLFPLRKIPKKHKAYWSDCY